MKLLSKLLLILIIPLSLKAEMAQKDLDKTRSEKLNAVARAVVEGDAKSLGKILDDGRSIITHEDAVALLKDIQSKWGDVSLDDKPESGVPDKGSMKVVAHKSFETTVIGRCVTLKGARTGDRVLRIYLLFPKGQTRIGAFTVADFAKP